MQGLMMDTPLTISSLIRHADRNHGETEIVSRTIDGSLHRSTYREVHSRSRRLANCLIASGVQSGDRIGTLAWNGYRHMELYFAVSGIGAICHTVNPRLFPEQIVYIINHAEDTQIFFDATFISLVRDIAPRCPGVRHWVLMTDRAGMAGAADLAFSVQCYEEEIGKFSDEFVWPDLDEGSASSLCYTSGTTGNPKGVLYSHRSTVLHTMALAMPDAVNLSERDVMLVVVPMFHANAWGTIYCAAAVGFKLVLPGPHLDPASLYELFESEGVTISPGVPTVWNGLLQFLQQGKRKFTSLKRLFVGGAAFPEASIRAFREHLGVSVIHAWGMTETSPLGTAATLLAKHSRLPMDAQYALLAKQGRVLFGVEMKIVGDDGEELPHDGVAFGNFLVRGPWVARGYFKGDDAAVTKHGWFATGDVATIDADGFMRITDRSKDVIKSGGEWISSISLESIAMAHPGVLEAAVIGMRHPKWDERPLLLIIRKPESAVTRDELLQFFEGKIAKWWMPDDVVFVDSLPHTATGKLLKTKLRDAYAGHVPGANAGSSRNSEPALER